MCAMISGAALSMLSYRIVVILVKFHLAGLLSTIHACVVGIVGMSVGAEAMVLTESN